MKRDATRVDITIYPHEYILYCATDEYVERVLFNASEILRVRKFLILHQFPSLTLREIPSHRLLELPPELSNL